MTLRLERASDRQRFEAKIDRLANGCWVWLAATDNDGYGRFSIGRHMKRAHRVSYETLRGEIPPGLDLDHLCRVRACVNPDHLEPVTRSVNLSRSPLMGAAGVARTHCPHGHAYSVENTMYQKGGARVCRNCKRLRWETGRHNPHIECDTCAKTLRKANMAKHAARFHPSIAEEEVKDV